MYLVNGNFMEHCKYILIAACNHHRQGLFSGDHSVLRLEDVIIATSLV